MLLDIIINKILLYNKHPVAYLFDKYKEIYCYNGYDGYGYNFFGFNEYGFTRTGYDRHGYNRYGYNKYGYDKNGECEICIRHESVCKCFLVNDNWYEPEVKKM